MDYFLFIGFASLVVFFAFFFRGLTGFANSLVIVPLLSLFLDIRTVIGLSAPLSFIAGAILFFSTKQKIEKRLLFILVFVCLGTFFGTYFLTTLNLALLMNILAVIIILFGVQFLLALTFEHIPRFWFPVAGIVSGVLDGLFSMGGPPLVAYFGNQLKKEAFRATVNTIFFLQVSWLNFLLIIRGVTTSTTFSYTLLLVPALLLGLYFGAKVNAKIDEKTFKKIIGILLLFFGISIFFLS